jgi:hypothetical protein
MAPAPTRKILDDPSLRCTSVPYTAICPSYLHPWGATRAADRGCKRWRKDRRWWKVGFRLGKKEGRTKGRKEGRKDEREEGRKEGRKERKEGRKEGRKGGRKEGRTKGRKEGRKEEREEGRKDGRIKWRVNRKGEVDRRVIDARKERKCGRRWSTKTVKLKNLI